MANFNKNQNAAPSSSLDVESGCENSNKSTPNLPLEQGTTASSDSVDIGVGAMERFQKRHNTCPQISPLVTNQPVHPSPRDTQSLSLPQSNTRKSFFGELRNLLTFSNKKKEEPESETLRDQIASGSSIEKGHEKENKKVALQNRRKQVFQSQEDDATSETSNVDFTVVGSTV